MTAPLARPLAEILFISEFAAFARAKGKARYDYDDAKTCALAQMAQQMLGIEDARGGGDGWFAADCYTRLGSLPYWAWEVAVHRPHTWPALADRLEALLADAPVVERGQ